jgi:plastocyanin
MPQLLDHVHPAHCPATPAWRGMRRLSCAVAMAAAATGAHAASISVQVTDAAGKALPDAAVYLESKEARAAVKPGLEKTIAQVGMQFSPRVSIVTVGTAVAFPNQDKVRHHVYSFSPAKNFELKLYAGTPASPVVFDRSGIALLGCNIHDNMAAWVVVVDTPYHGRTGADGRVVLEGVPSGSYQLRAWHSSQPVGNAASEQAVAVSEATAPVSVKLKDAR